MTDDDRRKWDERYGTGDYRPRLAAGEFLESWIPRIRPGRALDLACGAGRNAIRLAQAGWQVDAVDVSSVAVGMAETAAAEAGVDVNWIVADLDDYEIPTSRYDLITVIRYRHPALATSLLRALAPDGWLLMEHHLSTSAEVHGPSNPEFRLRPQELLEAFAALRVVFYEETIEARDDRGEVLRLALARLVACKGDPGF